MWPVVHTEISAPASLVGTISMQDGAEDVILTCRNGKVWAIRPSVINGYITFLTRELGSYLILGSPDKLRLTEDGATIILYQPCIPFGG